jgi:maltose O-acetyltransferase
MGPRVGLYTAGHPIDAAIRAEELEYGWPITIGNDVWIGGNVVINPGVTIGSNVVIGSGSVVTHDIPDNVVAVGNPCHVLREITADDHDYWAKQRAAYFADRDDEN